MKKRIVTYAYFAKVKRLHKKGLTGKEISERIGGSVSTVFALLRSPNVQAYRDYYRTNQAKNRNKSGNERKNVGKFKGAKKGTDTMWNRLSEIDYIQGILNRRIRSFEAYATVFLNKLENQQTKTNRTLKKLVLALFLLTVGFIFITLRK